MNYLRVAQHVYDVLDTDLFIYGTIIVLTIKGFLCFNLTVGIAFGVLGFLAICILSINWSHIAIDLEENDIAIAIHNYVVSYQPGMEKIKFKCRNKFWCFGKRDIATHTKGKQFVLWYSTAQWSGILNETDDKCFLDICRKEPVRTAQWNTNKTFLIPKQDDQDKVIKACLYLIRHLIDRSGGTVADVKAIEDIGSIWVDASDQANSPVPFVKFNFKGKKDGRPVLTLTDRKGYWIFQENGELEPFADVDA